MDLPIFQRRTDCSDCVLHASAIKRCIPSRPADPDGKWVTGKSRALFVVGEGPGFNEDVEDKCFVGKSGHYLDHIYMAPFKFHELVDIYYGNATRCRPPQHAKKVPEKSVKACRPYLLDDLRRLSECYEDVTILCVGAVALKSVAKKSLTGWFKSQGQSVTIDLNPPKHKDVHQITTLKELVDDDVDRLLTTDLLVAPVTFRVFATYHPAALTSKRDPTKIIYVKDHLRLLYAYLTDQGTFDAKAVADFTYTRNTEPPDVLRYATLDIETYGILEGFSQKYFHPLKSERFDKVPPEKQIISATISYVTDRVPTTPAEVQTVAFVFPQDIPLLARWLYQIRLLNCPLGLKNAQFDLLYLRWCVPQLRNLLDDPILIVDIDVLNFLYAEDRPERSLKNLAPLHGLPAYRVSAAHNQWPRSILDSDPNPLLSYNAQDTGTTLLLWLDFEKLIAGRYQKGTAKLSDYSMKWYSQLIWMCVWMSEAGVSFNRFRLERIRKRVLSQAARTISQAKDEHNLILKGKGRNKSIDELIVRCVDAAGLRTDRRLKLTGIEQKISSGEENINLCLETLPPDHPERSTLEMLVKYRWLEKLEGTYLRPKLEGQTPKKKGSLPNYDCLLVDGQVYPAWFVVPSQYADSDTAKSGGTNQIRITCKQPALQTEPEIMLKALTTRFCPGFSIHDDGSQLELRIGALLSGDTVMIGEYDDPTIDRHANTAIRIFGPAIRNHPEWPKYRQFGKTANFLRLFRGEAPKLQMTALSDLGIALTIEQCQTFIDGENKRYPQFAAWQDYLIRTAKSQGYLEVPLIGASRQFYGSPKMIDATYIPTICNMLVQAVAAAIYQSAQFAITRELRRRMLRSLCTLNTYDSIDAEGPLIELPIVQTIFNTTMEHIPFFEDLCGYLGRRVRFAHELKVKLRTH